MNILTFVSLYLLFILAASQPLCGGTIATLSDGNTTCIDSTCTGYMAIGCPYGLQCSDDEGNDYSVLDWVCYDQSCPKNGSFSGMAPYIDENLVFTDWYCDNPCPGIGGYPTYQVSFNGSSYTRGWSCSEAESDYDADSAQLERAQNQNIIFICLSIALLIVCIVLIIFLVRTKKAFKKANLQNSSMSANL